MLCRADKGTVKYPGCRGLLLAGMAFAFLAAAHAVLCFALVAKTVSITHWGCGCC